MSPTKDLVSAVKAQPEFQKAQDTLDGIKPPSAGRASKLQDLYSDIAKKRVEVTDFTSSLADNTGFGGILESVLGAPGGTAAGDKRKAAIAGKFADVGALTTAISGKVDALFTKIAALPSNANPDFKAEMLAKKLEVMADLRKPIVAEILNDTRTNPAQKKELLEKHVTTSLETAIGTAYKDDAKTAATAIAADIITMDTKIRQDMGKVADELEVGTGNDFKKQKEKFLADAYTKTETEITKVVDEELSAATLAKRAPPVVITDEKRKKVTEALNEVLNDALDQAPGTSEAAKMTAIENAIKSLKTEAEPIKFDFDAADIHRMVDKTLKAGNEADRLWKDEETKLINEAKLTRQKLIDTAAANALPSMMWERVQDVGAAPGAKTKTDYTVSIVRNELGAMDEKTEAAFKDWEKKFRAYAGAAGINQPLTRQIVLAATGAEAAAGSAGAAGGAGGPLFSLPGVGGVNGYEASAAGAGALAGLAWAANGDENEGILKKGLKLVGGALAGFTAVKAVEYATGTGTAAENPNNKLPTQTAAPTGPGTSTTGTGR